MVIELTKKEALALYDSKFWEKMTYKEKATFQLFTSRLCMPFYIFHEAVEKTLGRPVFTHEFVTDNLKEEFLGKRKAPSFKEIFELIPKDKSILMVIKKKMEDD